MIFFFKVVTGTVRVSLFVLPQVLVTRTTRSNSNRNVTHFTSRKCNTVTFQGSFFNRTTSNWNTLANDLQLSCNLQISQFKSIQYLPLPPVYAFFSASLPAIASGEKSSAKCRFFDMAFFQRTSTDTITVKISFKQNQLLPLTKSAQSASNQYRIHRRATRNINQTKPIASLHETAPRSASNQ